MLTKKNILVFLFSVILLAPTLAIATSFDYTPMQQVPGSATPTSFCDYVQAVYKFGIWTVGIAAMFMIMFGGYTYLLSAGNNASMEKAKGFIFDAIAGLVLALVAYLILYVINPDLVKIKIICEASATTHTPPIQTHVGPMAPSHGPMTPLPPTALSPDCDKYADDFRRAAGSNNKDFECMLIAIANQESSCNPKAGSEAGACGLMQLMPATAQTTCDKLKENPGESIAKAGALLLKSQQKIGSGSFYSQFAIGNGFGQNGNAPAQYGAYTYDTGNDDLIASYNAGAGKNTNTPFMKGPFDVSSDCPTDPKTPAWQCDINPGGFLETQRYVMRVQQLQKECLAKQS